MTRYGESGCARELPVERLSSLSTAMLRISASLDLATVLREVAESTRVLTGAQYSALTTIDETGHPQDFVTSGFTDAEHQAMAEWADGPKLFEHFRDLASPLNLTDVHAYVRSLGFSADRLPSRTFLGTPMRHRGIHVGNFYLVEKASGQEFTSEDEEVLLVFASQAAAAIANARAYRHEQRARAHLEALVETSPVGVVVFEAQTGCLVSLNREARRIAEDLRMPGHSPEQLLAALTCRFSDGRELALDQFPISSELTTAQTVRAEEIVLTTPDGRSVTMLINATPIPAEDDEIDSVVVTMQDLAPLKELDRMRAEFLSMVSHELRTPLAAIKGSVTTLLDPGQGMSPVETQQFFRIIYEQANRMNRLISDLLDMGRLDAGTLSITPEPSEIILLVEQARIVFQSSHARHTVQIDLPPDLPLVMADRGRLVQVLNNLFTNAARHAPESSAIQVTAEREGLGIAVSVSDDGQGMTPEQLATLFRKSVGVPGGTREPGAEGSGLGLAICKGLVEAHGGRIRAESAGPGQGTRVTFTVPVAEVADSIVPSQSKALRADGQRTRILVVDDDPLVLRSVRETLQTAGYAPLVTADHRELPHLLEVEKPALVLLDLILPGTDGVGLMETLPQLTDLPVIFISGYGRDETIAKALEAGADDYIVKPFSPTELIARIRATLRRRSEPDPFVLGDLAIDYARRRVRVAGRTVPLTATEYELLRVLSLAGGRVVTYDALLRQVWSGRSYGEPKKLVRAFIKKLREKLGDDADASVYIFNERSIGYRMATPGGRRDT